MTRIEREKRTVALMLRIYCRGNGHRGQGVAAHAEGDGADFGLCPSCEELRRYAFAHLDRCPFGERKTSCRRCLVHCYSPSMRPRIAAVMRYSGPRMFLRAPLAALAHLFA